MLTDLLKDNLPKQFDTTPLQAFGAKVQLNHFTPTFRHLQNLEEALALVETRERLQK